MRKVTTTVAAALVAFSFAACNKTDNEAAPEIAQGNTYAQLTFQETGLRAIQDGQNDAPGIEGESRVKNASFFAGSASQAVAMSEVDDFTPTGAEEDKAYKSEVFEYKGVMGSEISSGLVVNLNTLSPADFKANKKLNIAELGKLTSNDTDGGFVMSSKTDNKITITEGAKATEDDVKAKGNYFSYQVERVASKAQASTPAGGVEINITIGGQKNPFGAAVLKDQRYALAGSAKEVYLFADKAGTRELGTDQTYGAKYETAIHGVAATTINAQGMYEKQRDLQKVSDLSLTTLSDDADFATLNSLPLVADAKYQTESNKNGIFFLENDVDSQDPDYSDVAYFKVYGKFEPADNIFKLNDAKDGVVKATMADVNADREEKVVVTEEWYNANKDNFGAGADVKKDEVADGEPQTYTVTVKIAAGSIFYNPANRRFYTSPLAARVDNGDKNQKVETILYKGGKMLWQTPANGQYEAKYFNTRRNNIYSIQVNEITGLGLNFDPADPTDPNCPKPNPEDNPDEKPHKDDNKVIKKTTNIQVEAKILKWNLVYRGVSLNGQDL